VTSRCERKKIEMLFAHLKRILRLDRLRLRGPSGAQDEFLLAATVQNLRKLAKLIPCPPQCRPESKQTHARLIPCNIPNSWAADFFNTICRVWTAPSWQELFSRCWGGVDVQHEGVRVGASPPPNWQGPGYNAWTYIDDQNVTSWGCVRPERMDGMR
jgi:Transposase DDE domain